MHTVNYYIAVKNNCINSLKKYILRAYYMPDTVLGAEDSTMRRTESLPSGSLQIDLPIPPTWIEDRKSKL